MPYEPLHHKYRPKTFAELVGQEAIATTLTNAINTLKIAPAYLFTGPRGTGKTSSARILAKSLNCLDSDKPTPQPCGKCDVCQGISKGATLDVIEIDAASNTGVDNIREIIEKAQFAPVQCRYKVYVVDECHMLSTQAFNALLKTLEEPPLHVVFVLATTDPQRVLPTIISRCQRFDFRRIPIDAMVQHLSNIATKENINITKEAVTLVAQVAQGGLRDAQSLLDQLGLLSQEVTPEKVWDLVGSVSEHDLLDLLKSIISDNSEAVIDCTRKILDRGREPLIILQNLASFYRDLLIAKTAPNRNDLVACTQVIWEVLVDVAQNLEISPILYGQQHLRTAEVQIKNTTQPRLWLEITLLGLLPSAITIGSPAIGNQQNLPLVTSNPPKTNHPATTPPVQQTPPFVRASHPPVEKNAGIPKQGENGTTRQQSTSTPSNPSTPNHSSSPPHLQQQGEPPQRNGSSTPQQLQQRKEPPQNSGSSNPQQLQQVSEPFEQQRMGENTPFPSKSGDDADNSLPKTEQVQQTSGSSTSDYSSPPQQTPAQPDVNQVWQQVLANFVPVRQRELLRQMCYLVDFDGSVACVAVKGAWYEKVKKEQSKILTAFQGEDSEE